MKFIRDFWTLIFAYIFILGVTFLLIIGVDLGGVLLFIISILFIYFLPGFLKEEEAYKWGAGRPKQVVEPKQKYYKFSYNKCKEVVAEEFAWSEVEARARILSKINNFPDYYLPYSQETMREFLNIADVSVEDAPTLGVKNDSQVVS
jgi:hypothetical protein